MENLRGPSKVSENKMFKFMEEHLADPDFAIWVTRTYYILGKHFNIRPEIMLLQAIKETATFTSVLFRECNNFAGVGVTGDWSSNPSNQMPPKLEGTDWFYDSTTTRWTATLILPDHLYGALCHFYHMMIYVDPQSSAPSTHLAQIGSVYDERIFYAWKKRGGLNAIKAVTLANLSGTWATSLTYSQDLQRDYNSLIAWIGKN